MQMTYSATPHNHLRPLPSMLRRSRIPSPRPIAAMSALLYAATAWCFTNSGAALAQDGVNLPSGRPSTVPPEYIGTPSGYFHPSCMLEWRPDEEVRGNTFVDPITHTRRVIPRCKYPRFKNDGTLVPSDDSRDVIPPAVRGWVEDMETTTLGAAKYLTATFITPPAPGRGGATVFLFPGLVPQTDLSFILQPVLQWNQRGMGVDNRWSIAPYNCCRDGNMLYGQPLPVEPGQRLFGAVWGTDCDPFSNVCQNWFVSIGVPGGATITYPTDSYGLALDYAVAGALEVVNFSNCGQLPARGSLVFDNIGLQLASSSIWVEPAWSLRYGTAALQCALGASQVTAQTGTAVRLDWWPSDRPQPSFPSSCGVIQREEGLRPGEYWFSCDGRFMLAMQTDGNLVWYDVATGEVIWASNTWHRGDWYESAFATMQVDGNFVVYAPVTATWATGTNGSNGSYFALQDDGNLVVYDETWTAVWATGTFR